MDAAQHTAAYESFLLAVDAAGSQSEFERLTGAKQQNISNWIKKRKLLRGEFVLAAERTTGISRHDLRPDLYPREDIATEAEPAR